MTIDDKTRTELEAAVFRRLVEHLQAAQRRAEIDLMNLAGFCRNCLSNWYRVTLPRLSRRRSSSKDEFREIVYGMPYEELEGEATQGTAIPEQLGGDEESPARALILAS